MDEGFLTDAASDYLSSDDYDQLSDDWADLAAPNSPNRSMANKRPCAPPTHDNRPPPPPARRRHRYALGQRPREGGRVTATALSR